jgi:hypothetical protein
MNASDDDTQDRIDRAERYLADPRMADRRAEVDASEFLRIYSTEGGTLDKAWRVARARKNQREAARRITA